MKVIDNILYLDVADAEQCGLGNASYIYKERSRGAKWATFIKDPMCKNLVLIDYESLVESKKEKVRARFGNPYDHYSKAPIRSLVIKDAKAEQFFFDFRFTTGESLAEEKIRKYTTAASWLNMLINAQDDFKSIKKELSITVSKFWLQVCDIIEEDNVALPSNYRVLHNKIKTYKEGGYESLIHKLHGKKSNAAKVEDEVSEALLLQLISMPNSDDVMTARRYNKWAVENNKPQISRRTVTHWKLEHKAIISHEKFGNKKTYNEFGKYIPRKRPSAPLLLVEHDDNELDLYFQSRRTRKSNGKTSTEVYYFNRFVVAVVIDAYNDYPLGWAYAETYTKDLIRFAYLDAVHHIKELTGDWYLPHQIRSDRFGLDPKLKNDLAQFYQSLATFTPASVGAARGKYIERSFGKQWHQLLKCYPNYAGGNITSNTHISEEFGEANRKDYPTTEQAPLQIRQFIDGLRQLQKDSDGLSRQEQWLKAFHESEKSKEKAITEEIMLSKLGTPHSQTNKLTNRGITPTINCVERMYEIPEAYYQQYVGRTVQVIYDPMDYSRILVTDGAGLRFIARTMELMPSAIADFQPGDRQRLNDRLQEKVRFNEKVTEKRQHRVDVLTKHRIDAESYLMAGVQTKAITHEATNIYTASLLDKPLKEIPTTTDTGNIEDDILDEM